MQRGKPLAEGFFPAIRMRQEIHGEWLDSRRFGLDTFFYYVAPVDTVRLELTAFPLRMTYYADRVDISAVSEQEAATLRIVLSQGFNEVPEGLRDIHGVVLDPGRARRLSFPYRQFVPFNADIDAKVERSQHVPGAAPTADLTGGIDLFCMYIPPAMCPDWIRTVWDGDEA